MPNLECNKITVTLNDSGLDEIRDFMKRAGVNVIPNSMDGALLALLSYAGCRQVEVKGDPGTPSEKERLENLLLDIEGNKFADLLRPFLLKEGTECRAFRAAELQSVMEDEVGRLAALQEVQQMTATDVSMHIAIAVCAWAATRIRETLDAMNKRDERLARQKWEGDNL